jgi:hypothetical protein
MTTIPYKCKFCKNAGTARYDETVCVNVSKWIPYLACDKCANYHVKRISKEDKIFG